MKKIIKTLIFAIFFVPALQAQDFIQAYADVANQVTQTNVTAHLTDFENLGVKRRGTPALQNTLNWLKDNYLNYGYTASQLAEDSYQNGFYTCKNLIVTKTGTLYPNTFVIICGHYDTVSGTGTNDNGSGTASILEVARLLQNIPTEYSIKFIHFSGEEDGLRGSEHYVDNVVNGTSPKLNIKLVFNLDQVGGVAGMINNTITCDIDQYSPSSNNAASAIITDELANCVQLYSPLNAFIDIIGPTDYLPFQSNNEVVTGFYETNISDRPHSNTDLLVNMDPEYVYNVAKASVGAMLHFAVASTSILSTSTYNAQYQVAMYPNPTKGLINIDFGQLASQNKKVQIIDTYGKVVAEKEFAANTMNNTVDVSFLPKGMYVVRINTDDNAVSKKIIVN